MNYGKAVQGVKNAVSYLEKITQTNNCDYQNSNKKITWYKRLSGIQTKVYYPIEYQHQIDNQQYSLLLSDGSFFQFYYEFNSANILKKARLVFYPKPDLIPIDNEILLESIDNAAQQEESDLFEHLYNWNDLIDGLSLWPVNTSHLRFDYDPSAKGHSPSHIQFSGTNDLRITADFFPQPLSFVQLCLPLIPGELKPLKIADMGFEKNNIQKLAKTGNLISLISR